MTVTPDSTGPEIPYFTPAQLHAMQPDWVLEGLSDADYRRACAMVAARRGPRPDIQPTRTVQERAARILEIYRAECALRGLPPEEESR